VEILHRKATEQALTRGNLKKENIGSLRLSNAGMADIGDINEAQATTVAGIDPEYPRGSPLAFHGTLIHTLTPKDLLIQEKSLIVVAGDGKIRLLHRNVRPDQVDNILSDYTSDVIPVKYLQLGQFLIPAFVDTHNHAPQWAQRGVGQGKVLMDWLNDITFPHEARFADPAYARKMYGACVRGGLRQGITTASYYGSQDCHASKVLAEVCFGLGQRALVGKCNMNRNAPDWYRDQSAEESVRHTKEFIAHVRSVDPDGGLVAPILTPRFAISCDKDVLTGLGEIAKENPDLPIQTHFNEAEQEIQLTKELFPEFPNEADLYEHFGLLGKRSILAHCIFLDDYQMERVKALDCGIAHCPISTAIIGPFMAAPIREYLRRDIKVGLGTDNGGGFSSSILDVIRLAFVVSNARQEMSNGRDPVLTIQEIFFSRHPRWRAGLFSR